MKKNFAAAAAVNVAAVHTDAVQIKVQPKLGKSIFVWTSKKEFQSNSVPVDSYEKFTQTIDAVHQVNLKQQKKFKLRK